MAILKLLLNKLEEPTVTHISMVDRGANRIPFRIIKRDNGTQETKMINLSKIFKGDTTKKGASTPAVIGVVVEKSDDFDVDAFKTKGGELGYTVSDVEDQDNVVVFKSGDQTDGLLVRVSDHSLALIANASLPEVEIFKEENEAGFYPGLSYAANKFKAMTMEAVEKGDTAAVTSLATQYEEYTTAFKATVPELTYKLDELVATGCQKAKPETPAEPEVVSKEEDPAPAEAATPEEPVSEQENVTKVEDLISGLVAKMDSAIAALTDSVTNLSGSVDAKISAIQTSVDGLGAKLDEVETVAKAASESVKGTVVGAPPAGDAEGDLTVRKSGDSDPRTGSFDTAYLPKRNVSGRNR